jgi:PAS domain S-box-containing protein
MDRPGPEGACTKIKDGMDWPAIARILGERGEGPVALLDGSGRVQMVNRAMEGILGFTRFELEGRPWGDLSEPCENEPTAGGWIAEALRGSLESHRVTVRTKSSSKVVFEFEFRPIGHPPNQALLMSATQVHSIPDVETVGSNRERDYEIATRPNFGLLARVWLDAQGVSFSEGSHCYALLHGLNRPCEDCPALQSEDVAWPRAVVREGASSTTDRTTCFEVTTAERAGANLVRLRTRCISEDTLRAVQDARVQKLAAQAKLSPREREVLGQMLLGRSIEDMAKLIGISARTVKHHQARVLEKIGADSRADLIRLLL